MVSLHTKKSQTPLARAAQRVRELNQRYASAQPHASHLTFSWVQGLCALPYTSSDVRNFLG